MSFTEKYNAIYNYVKQDVEQVKEEVVFKICGNKEFSQKFLEMFNAPSKHIRSVVSFLYLRATGIVIEKPQIKYQAVIELIHNGSLIHDDIIDNSDLRRGKTTFNKQFGKHMGVVAGDLILSYALKLIWEINNPKITNIISDTITDMCNGEIKQHFQQYEIPTLEEYIEKTYLKTGSLFKAAIEGGIEISQKSEYYVDAKNFAKLFGIAFQIRDDIKNITDNRKDSDIKNGIYTAPVIYSQNPDNPIAGIEKAKDLLSNYIEEAKKFLKNLPENEYKTALTELLGILKNE